MRPTAVLTANNVQILSARAIGRAKIVRVPSLPSFIVPDNSSMSLKKLSFKNNLSIQCNNGALRIDTMSAQLGRGGDSGDTPPMGQVACHDGKRDPKFRGRRKMRGAEDVADANDI
jgi:hypothetical protein